MDRKARCLVGNIFLFLISQVLGQCQMESRIQQRDSDVIVTSRESPCELVISSPDDRQVVAVFYNMQADCIQRGDIEIYDGNTTSNPIRRFCEMPPSSYASRRNGLVITLSSPYKPFDIEIYLIHTTETLILNYGRIQSPVYTTTNVTPNNFNGTYTISAEEDVTMMLTFNYIDLFYDKDKPCGDYVEIMSSSTKICSRSNGDRNFKPSPVIVTTKSLRVVFITDALYTYTGIDISYKVCFTEISEDTSKSIRFPIQSKNGMVCVLKFSFNDQRNISLSGMKFIPGCIRKHQITVDGVDRTSSILGTCTMKSYNFLGSDVKLRFTSTQTGSFTTGNYNISLPTTTTSSQSSTYTISGSVTSSYNHTQNYSDADTQGLSSSSTQIAPIIGGAIAGVVVLAVLISIAVFFILRKGRQQTASAKYNAETKDVQIYSDNENYDNLHQSRDKVNNSADKNKNIYGVTGNAISEYSSFNRNGKHDTDTSEYDVSTVDGTYDQMNRGHKKKTDIDVNIYE